MAGAESNLEVASQFEQRPSSNQTDASLTSRDRSAANSRSASSSSRTATAGLHAVALMAAATICSWQLSETIKHYSQ